MPRAAYTTPVQAAAGHTEASARAAGIDPVVVTAEPGEVVRSNTEGSTDGWLKLLASPPTASSSRARSGSSLPSCPPEPERAFRHRAARRGTRHTYHSAPHLFGRWSR
ncbi:MAG TPA: hypothetical protein VGC06_22880 [Actinomycetes bacterium]